MDLDVARIVKALQVIDPVFDPVFLNTRSTSMSGCAGRWAAAR